MQLSREARLVAGVIVLTVPTIMYGGLTLIGILTKGMAGLAPGRLALDDTQWALFRAGHAHAGVWVVLSLVIQVLLDAAAALNQRGHRYRAVSLARQVVTATARYYMSILTLISGVLLNVAIFGGLLFVPAGTLDWWRAWVFLGVVFGGAVASTVSVFRVNKDLLAERFKPPVQQGQPLADKIVVVLLIAGFVSVIVCIPLDVCRWHLMATPGILVSSLGLVLFVVGWWIMTLALRENAFAAPVVKHQADRQHTVIESGVYGVVRHPMYAGAVLLLVGMPLWLESYAAALLASIPIGTLVVRILVEELFLRRALAGYNAYTERVRYRLIPFVW